MSNDPFDRSLTPAERDLVAGLDTPRRIQDFLDTIAFEAEYFNRCPLRVLRERRGHCYDGALFAAVVLRRLGHEPLVLDLVQEPGADDDHMLALYRQHGRWGAIAKSNFAGLRFREPVYASLRELVMSYFESYYNRLGRKTLRAYTRPLHLRSFDRLNWTVEDAGADAVERRLLQLRQIPLITPEMAAGLSPVDRRSYEAGLLGADPEGLFTPQDGAAP